MEGVLSIFQGILRTNYVDVYLDALEEQQSFSSKASSGADDVAQTISSLLMKNNTRPKGLQLLNAYLMQCPLEIAEQKFNTWTTFTLKSCNHTELSAHAVDIYGALAALAEISQKSPDLTKQFGSNHLLKIYESLVNVSPAGELPALLCVEKCLRLYPGSSGQARGSLEKFLTRFVDTLDQELNRVSGRCLQLLQQVRGGGVQGENHKTQWKNYQLKLLGSLQAVLDELYGSDDEAVEREQLAVPALKLSDEPVQRAAQLYIRFRNLVEYLELALREPFPVEKAIMPKKILQLIERGLSVTCVALQQNVISENLALSAFLPRMHMHLLDLLFAMIQVLGSHLRPYHGLILGVLADTLKWTATKSSYGLKKPFCGLRIKAYQVLMHWCSTLQCGSRCELLADQLVQQVLNDVQPYQIECTLKVLSGARKRMSKKARRQLHNAQNEQSNVAMTHANTNALRKENLSDEGNQPLCIAALKCLQAVFTVAASFIKPTLIRTVQTCVLRICSAFYELPLKSQHLYHSSDCRMEIFNTLYIILTAVHPLCPPPMELALKVLQTARLSDGNDKVRNQCSAIIVNLEKLIHPQKESLQFPVELREIRNTFVKLGQERLLGAAIFANTINEDEAFEEEPEPEPVHNITAERVDSEEEDEEEVVLCEAPLKKARLEVEDEAIDIQNNEIMEVEDADEEELEAPVVIENTSASVVAEDSVDEAPTNNVVCIEDDESSSSVEITSVSKPVDEKLAAPLAQKVTEKDKEETSNVVILDEPAKPTDSLTDEQAEDDILADIEAAFVDELN